MTDRAHGAYGFVIHGIEAARHLLNPMPPDRPSFVVAWEEGDPYPPPQNRVRSETAAVPFVTGGAAFMDRETRTARVVVPEPLDAEEIAHPFLAPIASVFAHWEGWIPFHAGGVMIGGRAWGIVGEREAGKSSLVAALAVRGFPILADDVVVIDADRNAFAGPRTLDLREGAADHFGVGRELGIVGLRERWRFDLGLAPVAAPLAGWIFPEWGDDIAIGRVTGTARLRRLAVGRTVLVDDVDPRQLLRLVELPALTFARPRRWEDLDAGIDALLDAVSAQEPR